MGGGIMTFRLFTNDRGKERGVPMYSALTSITASTAASAAVKASKRFASFGPPQYAAMKAVEWPPTSPASKAWLAKHVGPDL